VRDDDADALRYLTNQWAALQRMPRAARWSRAATCRRAAVRVQRTSCRVATYPQRLTHQFTPWLGRRSIDRAA
jgi:hypothetical protein